MLTIVKLPTCTPTIPAGQNFDNAILLNAGSLENRGVEIALSGKPVQTDDWYLELGVNVAYNDNEITELYGGRDVIEAGMKVGTDQQITYHKVGLPIPSGCTSRFMTKLAVPSWVLT